MQSICVSRSPVLWAFAFALARYAVALPAQAATVNLSRVAGTPDREVVDDAVITVVSTRFSATPDAAGAFSLTSHRVTKRPTFAPLTHRRTA